MKKSREDYVIDDMKEKRKWLQKRSERIKRKSTIFLGPATMLIVLAPFASSIFETKLPSVFMAALFAGYGIVLAVTFYLPQRVRLRFLSQQIQDIDFEIDLMQFRVSRRESRAEKLLRINSVQLRRYYELNLRQNIWVFGIGVFCILLGFAIIGVTLYLVTGNTPKDAKIIIAVVGSIGSILSNFIASIYLKIHAKASANLGDFHLRLVGTQQILLGNLVASRIENEIKREATLSQLSVELVKKG